jgi:MFS family permease
MKLRGGALGERNFRFLFFARAISFFGTNLAPIAVAFAVLDLTGSATDVGIAFACWTLAQISTLLVGGVAADQELARRRDCMGDHRDGRGDRLTPRTASPAFDSDHAVLAGFAFSFGTVIWDTSLQQTIAPEKLARVSAYNWMGAMAFLPAGYAVAGPVADAIGTSNSLWIGAAWVVVTTAIVISVRDVRQFPLKPVQAGELAPAIATS